MKLKPEFLESLKDLSGVDTPALVKSISESSAPISIRYNPAKTLPKELKEPVKWATAAEYLSERPVFTVDPLFHAGTYYVQEASSMFLEQAMRQHLDLEKPLVVLDLCAAPGGKSTLISSILKDNDVLISNEINKTRADVLTENIQKWGLPNVIVTRNQPSDFSQLNELFDCIVVDAPCSGEGMFRKTPNAMEEWSPANVQQCDVRQKDIIQDIWDCLKPGGILIYSTCTYNLIENELQAEWIADGFEADSLELDISQFPEISPSLIPSIQAARFFPHKTKGEGFFITVLQKQAKQKGRIRALKPTIRRLERKERMAVEHMLVPGPWTFFEHRSQVFAALPEMAEVLDRISSQLYPLHIGVPLGEVKGKDLIPSPGLAFSIVLDKSALSTIEVSREQALGLLSRETPQLDLNDSGWILTTYQGLGLVWLKVVQNRYNNYYPKEWRIRSDYRDLE